eukprot:TRINITY_DN53068_c1_g1_i1.p1 TRINITY_DN53068_c1_g1~~TRINITY_DN53068_c1_g1_i1.p1  ORF type:complete len:365 (+),score=34.86 TRINITY_DN53068_c1_g1_i1:102-1196(+)
MPESSRLPVPIMKGTPEEHPVNGDQNLYFPAPCWQLPYEQEVPMDTVGPLEEQPPCFEVPFYFRAEVFPPAGDTECILVATSNKRRWGQGGDGITAFAAVGDRARAFTFRLNLFDQFPKRVVLHHGSALRTGQWNEVGMAVSEDRATYWINGVRVATMFFDDEDVLPSTQLHVGFATYVGGFRYRNFDVSRDPIVLDLFRSRVFTLKTKEADGVTSVVCLAMSGQEVASLQIGMATQLIPGTPVYLAESVSAEKVYFDNEDQCWYQFDRNGNVRLPANAQAVVEYVFSRALLLRVSGLQDVVEVTQLEHVKVEASAEERLIEFRGRLADKLGINPIDFQLALPCGRYLGEDDNPRSLRTLLTAK